MEHQVEHQVEPEELQERLENHENHENAPSSSSNNNSNAILTRELISKSVNDFVATIPHQVLESFSDTVDFYSLRNTICIAKVLSVLNENHVVVVAYVNNSWMRLRVCLSGTVSWPLHNVELSRVSKNILETKVQFLRDEWFTLKIFGELPCLPDVIGSLYSQSGVDLSAYMLRQGLLLPYWQSKFNSQNHQIQAAAAAAAPNAQQRQQYNNYNQQHQQYNNRHHYHARGNVAFLPTPSPQIQHHQHMNSPLNFGREKHQVQIGGAEVEQIGAEVGVAVAVEAEPKN